MEIYKFYGGGGICSILSSILDVFPTPPVFKIYYVLGEYLLCPIQDHVSQEPTVQQRDRPDI